MSEVNRTEAWKSTVEVGRKAKSVEWELNQYVEFLICYVHIGLTGWVLLYSELISSMSFWSGTC